MSELWSHLFYLLQLNDHMKSNEINNRSVEEKLRGKVNELELKVHEARDELEQANKVRVTDSSVLLVWFSQYLPFSA